MNRKLPLLAVIVLFSLPVIFSCKKDKDEYEGVSTGTGTIYYQGNTYKLQTGVYELYGQFDGVYNYALYIISDGINVGTETGKGHILDMYFSTYDAPLPAGTIPYYTYNVPEVPTFDATVYLNYDLAEQTGTILSNFEDGSIKISKSGDSYTLELNCYTMDDDTVTVKYTGKILEI